MASDNRRTLADTTADKTNQSRRSAEDDGIGAISLCERVQRRASQTGMSGWRGRAQGRQVHVKMESAGGACVAGMSYAAWAWVSVSVQLCWRPVA